MQIKQKHDLVPGQRYQDSRHILQNPKVSKNVMGFNNHAQRSTPPYYLEVDNPLPLLFPFPQSLGGSNVVITCGTRLPLKPESPVKEC